MLIFPSYRNSRFVIQALEKENERKENGKNIAWTDN